MATVPEDTELLKYQTTILKVSIHCEACKKKVKKVLQGLEGVYSIDINSKQNKVTVTGSADAESLIRRLIKYGKHAELWPEKKPAATISSGPEAASDADTKPDAPVPKTDQQLLNTEKQQQPEELNNETIPSPPTESTATAPAADEAGASDEADELEKKGKQTQKETSSVDESAVANTNTVENTAAAAPAPAAAAAPAPAPASAADNSPPPPEKYPLYAQQVDSMSYRAVQPSTSYAYYMYSPAVASSYTYSGDHPPSVYPPENYMSDPYYGSMEAPARSGSSYDMFNDENPNACRLM